MLTLILWAPKFSQAIPLGLPSATNFYASPKSPFPSGQASRSLLEKGIMSVESSGSLRVQWDKKIYFLQREQVIRDQDCWSIGESKEVVKVHAQSQTLSPVLGELSATTQVEILSQQGNWFQVQEKNLQLVGWVKGESLKAVNEDLGYYTTLVDSYLRAKANFNSAVVTTLPRRVKLKVISIANGFLQTDYKGQRGFVDLNHLAGRSDFATWGLRSGKTWVLISHRENDLVITKDQERIPLAEITGFASPLNKGIISETRGGYDPPIKAHVLIHDAESIEWIKSRLDGHGSIWWKRAREDNGKSALPNLSTEEILRKNIFSMALEGKNKLKGLVSAKGVFRTLDGDRWEKIELFGDKDFPVAIQPNGTWYVGPYKSSDQGKSFSPYLRLEQLASFLEIHLAKSPKELKLLKIETSSNDRLKLLVDTGGRRLSLHYLLQDKAWRVD